MTSQDDYTIQQSLEHWSEWLSIGANPCPTASKETIISRLMRYGPVRLSIFNNGIISPPDEAAERLDRLIYQLAPKLQWPIVYRYSWGLSWAVGASFCHISKTEFGRRLKRAEILLSVQYHKTR